MPQSLVKILVHIVFSTKNRVNLISPDIEAQLFGYIGGIITNNKGRMLIAGGTANHIHILVSIGRIDIGEMIGDIKRDSSVWIKKQDRKLSKFYWQRGYGAFSIGQSQVSDVTRYTKKSIIINRHLKMNFEHFAKNMMSRSTNVIAGIDGFDAFSVEHLCTHNPRVSHSLNPRLYRSVAVGDHDPSNLSIAIRRKPSSRYLLAVQTNIMLYFANILSPKILTGQHYRYEKPSL